MLLYSLVVNLATVFDKGVFFIINIIIARYLSIDHFGEYVTALGYATFFSVFTDIGINQALVRAVNLEQKFEREYFGTTLALKALLSLVVYGVMALSLRFTNYSAATVCLTLILGVVRIGNVYLSSFYALFDAKQRFFITSFLNSSFSFSFLCGTLIVILYRGDYFDLAYVRAAIVIVYIAAVAALTFMNYTVRFRASMVRGFAAQTLPFTLAAVFSNLYQHAGILILSMMHGATSAGIFNNGNIFLVSLFFIPGNLNRVLLPYLYRYDYRFHREKFQFAHDLYAKIYAVMAMYIFITLFFFAHEIIVYVFGGKYAASVSVLRIAAFGVPFVFTVAGAIVTALDLQRYATRFQGITVVFSIAASCVLSYFFKAEGAALAMVLTYGMNFFLLNRFLMRNRYIEFRRTLTVYGRLACIAAVLYLLVRFAFAGVFFVYSFLAVSALYAVLVALLLLTKDDIRIVKETIGLKWK